MNYIFYVVLSVRLEKCSAVQVMLSEKLKPWQLDMAEINNAD